MLNPSISRKQSEAMRLWRSCFEDSEEFVQLYFSRVYRDEDTLLDYAPDGTTAVSHTQALPYRLQFSETSEPLAVGYISGACTDPAYRGQGYMQRLMEQALVMMYERGDVASFLIPASESLFTFYRQGFAYGTAFYEAERTIAKALSLGAERAQEPSEALAQAECHHARYSILHHAEQWATVLADYSLGSQSHIASLTNQTDELEAIALYLDLDDSIVLKVAYALPSRERELLKLINPQGKPLTQVIPVHAAAIESSRPKGMLRPLRLRRLIEEWVQGMPELELHIYVVDTLFPANTGSYTLSAGAVRYSPVQEPNAVPMKLSELVELVARICPLSMNFMLE